MKRKRIYCLLLATIGAILLVVLIIKFIIPQLDTTPRLYMCLAYIWLIFVPCLEFIKDKSRDNWYGMLGGVDGFLMICAYIMGSFIEMDEFMTSSVEIIFIITLLGLLLISLYALWNEADKSK